jgi:penicillin-binding protein 2
MKKEPGDFKRRLFWLQLLVSASFFLVLSSYYRTQVLLHEHYSELGEQNRTRKRTLPAARGLIFDREGRLLIRNLPSYHLVLQRDEMVEPFDTFAERLAPFLGLPREQLLETFNAAKMGLLSQPIALLDNISFAEVLRVKRNGLRFPGLSVEIGNRRDCVYPELFSHALGYVGQASEEELRADSRLRYGDVVGKRGLENSYNHLLQGSPGEKWIHINRQGLIFQEEIVDPAIPGENLVLSLDLDLQIAAQQALGVFGGVVLLMDVRSGELLAFVSSPSFDLNIFGAGMTRDQWQDLISQPGQPLFNRALQGLYAPGSIFKLVTILAALHRNQITPATRFHCDGSYQHLGRTFHCHLRTGHGELDLIEAIQKSCNLYMYQVAKDLGAQAIADTAEDLGLGKPSGIDIRGEKSGSIPSPRHKKGWYSGETLNMSIGQGAIQVTPMQLVRLMSIIASEGLCPEPHLLLRVEGNQARTFQPISSRCTAIAQEHFKTIKTAMWQVVNVPGATGAAACLPGFDVCGKTGTAQLLTFRNEADRKQERFTNAWFAGFAPLNRPRVAILVLAEQVGAGGARAAPVARQVLAAYQAKYGTEETL